MAKHGYRAVHPAALEGAAKGVKAVPADESLAGPGAVADEIHAARYGCDGRFRQLQLEAGEEGNDLLAASDRLVAADAEQNEVIDVAAVVPDAKLALAILEFEVAQLERQAHQHAQLLVFDIETGKRGLLVIALLRFHDEAIHRIGRAPDFQRETVLFVFRKVVQMNVHQLGEFHEFAVQFGFVMEPHRYRSGLRDTRPRETPGRRWSTCACR